jgi:hypothetical protein
MPIESTVITFGYLSSTRYGGSSVMLSLTMGDSWDGADSDILINEIFCGEFNESIIWFNWLVFLSFLELHEFTNCNILHGLKTTNKVFWMLLQIRVGRGISKSSEFAVDSLSPAGHLIINYINFLELFLKLAEIFILLTNHALHLKNILILESCCSFLSSSLISFSIDL